MVTLIRRQFLVEASLDATWEHLSRIEEWPTWAFHIRRIEVTPKGPLAANSAGNIHLRNGLRSTFRMMDFNPKRNWKWSGPFLWLTIVYDHEFEAVGDMQTRLTWTVSADGFGKSSFGRLFASIYNHNLNDAIPKLIDEMKSSASRTATL